MVFSPENFYKIPYFRGDVNIFQLISEFEQAQQQRIGIVQELKDAALLYHFEAG